MSIVLWLLGALAAGVIAEEFLGWVTPLCRALLRRGAQRLPKGWQARYAEEWEAELLALPEAAITRLLWTVRTRIGVRSLRATLSEAWTLATAESSGVTGEASLPKPTPLQAGGPTALGITLGAQLRRYREICGVELAEAAQVIQAPSSRLRVLESGLANVAEDELLDLLVLYGVTDPADIHHLKLLARQANVPGWWHHYADLGPYRFDTYAALEQSATVIRTFETHYIPGLLQTADYARAVIATGRANAEDIQHLVDVRLHRRQALTRATDQLNYQAIIDEAVFVRPYGDAQVMRGQIEYLLHLSESINVTLQILPLNSPPRLASVSFTILQLPEKMLPRIVYLEQLSSALYLDQPADINEYEAAIDEVSRAALSPDETRRLLQNMLYTFGNA